MFLFDYLPYLDFLENFNKSRSHEVSQRSFQSESCIVCGQMQIGGHTVGHDKANRRWSSLHAEAPKKSGKSVMLFLIKDYIIDSLLLFVSILPLSIKVSMLH
jgi:hypothetical protein